MALLGSVAFSSIVPRKYIYLSSALECYVRNSIHNTIHANLIREPTQQTRGTNKLIEIHHAEFDSFSRRLGRTSCLAHMIIMYERYIRRGSVSFRSTHAQITTLSDP